MKHLKTIEFVLQSSGDVLVLSSAAAFLQITGKRGVQPIRFQAVQDRPFWVSSSNIIFL